VEEVLHLDETLVVSYACVVRRSAGNWWWVPFVEGTSDEGNSALLAVLAVAAAAVEWGQCLTVQAEVEPVVVN
jgi:hypothetical protein